MTYAPRLWAVLLVLALMATRAYGACGSLSIPNMGSVDWLGAAGDYEVFDSTEYVQALTFDLKKKQGGQCNYVVGISTGGSGVFNPRELVRQSNILDYNVYDDASQSNVLQDFASGGTLITGAFTGGGANETHTLTYYWVIPKEQVVAASSFNYTDTLTFEAYQDDPPPWTLEDTATRAHRSTVASAVEVSLVDTGAGFNVADTTQLLDFGTLTLNENLAFDIRARGNVNFDVALQSTNSGVMAHTSEPDTVPYTLDVDGGPVDLSSGNPVTIASFNGGTTTLEGEVYQIDVTIGSVSGMASGTYDDTITVTISAQ